MKWLRRLLGIRSPSEEYAKFLRVNFVEPMVHGIRNPGPISPEALLHAEIIAKRAFGSLYEDDDE